MEQLATAIWALVYVFSFIAFLMVTVFVMEFLRRERTLTKDDDWIERKAVQANSSCCEHLKSNHIRIHLGLRYVQGTVRGRCTLCDCQKYVM